FKLVYIHVFCKMQPKEIQQLRAGTKGAAQSVHFNNAGSSLPPDVVVETVMAYLREEAVYGGYETEAKYAGQLENVYKQIAKLINAHQDEIAIVENASIAWHLAFGGVDLKPGDEVITSEMEYVTNHIGFLNAGKNYGIKVMVVANDAWGNFDPRMLEKVISGRTRLIAVTHVPSAAGNILPVEEIGRIARRHGVLYLVDACQSAGQLPLDVEAIGCDMLSVTGRKYLRAPRGTGFLYVRKTVQDQLRTWLLDGHSVASVDEHGYRLLDNARRFELYEKSRALMLGLGAAVSYALDLGLERIRERVIYLAGVLRSRLSEVEGVTVHDRGERLSGIVTFSVSGMDAAAVKAALAEKRINVSIGRAQSTLIYMNKHQLSTILRASVHYYNTEEEIEVLRQELCRML
ncbi:MAG TPA: aminotransferase class V-fold PLP-dependent enzyme, partial [Puia sp.]|nr:aminotransferase class V-fold PLP-dependent enzyme [Puia sp.]